MSTTRHEYPENQGMTWHLTQYYSLCLPTDWHSSQWDELANEGSYGFAPQDPFTIFSVAYIDLDTTIEANDLGILSEGYFDSVEELPAYESEARNQHIVGKQLQHEAKHTFREYGHTPKYWQHLVYHETHQIVCTSQETICELYQ